MTDRAWAAGLFDGEGCISLDRSNTFQTILKVAMYERRTCEKFKTLYGGRVFWYRNQWGIRTWVWKATRPAEIRLCLEHWMPWLIEKASQARILLKVVDLKQTRRRGSFYTKAEERRLEWASNRLKALKSKNKSQF